MSEFSCRIVSPMIGLLFLNHSIWAKGRDTILQYNSTVLPTNAFTVRVVLVWLNWFSLYVGPSEIFSIVNKVVTEEELQNVKFEPQPLILDVYSLYAPRVLIYLNFTLRNRYESMKGSEDILTPDDCPFVDPALECSRLCLIGAPVVASMLYPGSPHAQNTAIRRHTKSTHTYSCTFKFVMFKFTLHKNLSEQQQKLRQTLEPASLWHIADNAWNTHNIFTM